MPGVPVNIDALRSSNLRLNLRLDPLLILQLEDMLMDYLYAHYSTPELYEERETMKRMKDLYWMDILSGRNPLPEEQYRRLDEEFRRSEYI